MARIIAVANQKGGVGKTTTAVNLSACLAVEGKRVLLLDLDPQGNATSGLGIDKEEITQGVYEMLVDEVPITDVIENTVIDTLQIAPTTIDLAGAEVDLVAMEDKGYTLKQCMAPIVDDYDYIIIDCPPSLGMLTINALTASNSVLIPIQTEFYALEGVSQLVKTIELVQEELNTELELEGVVLTMYNGRTKLAVQVAEEVTNYFGDAVYTTTIPRNVKLGEAPSHGLPVVIYDKRSKGAEVYCALAREVIECGA